MDTRHPSLFTLTLLSIFVLYVQLIPRRDVPPPRHELVAARGPRRRCAQWFLTWTAIRALTVYSKIEDVRRPAITLLALMVTQLCLGFLAFLTRVAWGRDAVQPELPMVLSTVAHVAVGALLLATTVVLAIQVWRHVPVSFEERVPTAERKPVTAYKSRSNACPALSRRIPEAPGMPSGFSMLGFLCASVPLVRSFRNPPSQRKMSCGP